MNKQIYITYWVAWENHLSEATSLAAAIKNRFGLQAELIKGIGGVFKVVYRNQVIFDNDPKYGEVPVIEDIILKIEKLNI